MKLQNWMDKSGYNDTDFARLTGLARSSIVSWRTGGRIPRPAQMEKIHEITNGAVSAADWYDFPQVKQPTKEQPHPR